MKYSIHNRRDAIPERIDDGNTTGVETPSAIAAAGRKTRTSRPTDRVIEIEDDSEVLQAIAARIRAEFRLELDDLNQRVRYLERDRDNKGRR